MDYLEFARRSPFPSIQIESAAYLSEALILLRFRMTWHHVEDVNGLLDDAKKRRSEICSKAVTKAIEVSPKADVVAERHRRVQKRKDIHNKRRLEIESK